jgi:hypothetical protein
MSLKLVFQLAFLGVLVKSRILNDGNEWKGLDRMPENAGIREIKLSRAEPQVNKTGLDDEKEPEKEPEKLIPKSWDPGKILTCRIFSSF